MPKIIHGINSLISVIFLLILSNHVYAAELTEAHYSRCELIGRIALTTARSRESGLSLEDTESKIINALPSGLSEALLHKINFTIEETYLNHIDSDLAYGGTKSVCIMLFRKNPTGVPWLY